MVRCTHGATATGTKYIGDLIMKPDELYTRLCIAPDATAEVIALFNEVDWPTALANVPKNTPAQEAAQDAAREAAWDAAWEAARDAAQDAARNAAWGAAREAAWEAERGAAWGAARDAAREAAGDAARGAALLAGCMVVRDIIGREHMDTALTLACRWLNYPQPIDLSDIQAYNAVVSE